MHRRQNSTHELTKDKLKKNWRWGTWVLTPKRVSKYLMFCWPQRSVSFHALLFIAMHLPNRCFWDIEVYSFNSKKEFYQLFISQKLLANGGNVLSFRINFSLRLKTSEVLSCHLKCESKTAAIRMVLFIPWPNIFFKTNSNQDREI